MFSNTLDMIPNGVLIIDKKYKSISFANKEMLAIVGADESPSRRNHVSNFEYIREKACLFFLHEQTRGVGKGTESG